MEGRARQGEHDQRRAIEAYFEFCDGDKDGYITAEELADALLLNLAGGGILAEGDGLDLLLGELQFADYFRAADLNKDAKLSLDEVLAYHEQRRKQQPSEGGGTGPKSGP
jgi:Ca2+-binding EF-hand superfamily protein